MKKFHVSMLGGAGFSPFYLVPSMAITVKKFAGHSEYSLLIGIFCVSAGIRVERDKYCIKS